MPFTFDLWSELNYYLNYRPNYPEYRDKYFKGKEWVGDNKARVYTPMAPPSQRDNSAMHIVAWFY